MGPEPLDSRERALWREERQGALVLLAGLADYDTTLLRRAALDVADELGEPASRALLLDAPAVEPVNASDLQVDASQGENPLGESKPVLHAPAATDGRRMVSRRWSVRLCRTLLWVTTTAR